MHGILVVPSFLSFGGITKTKTKVYTTNKKETIAMATKKKGGYRPFHNHNNHANHHVQQACEFVPDEGPASAVLLFESPDGDMGYSATRFYRVEDVHGKPKDVFLAADDAEPLRGFLCVKSRTEDFSVHEVRMVPPRLRFVFKNETDANDLKNPIRVSVVAGPCIVSVPSVVYNCPTCGEVITTSREFMDKNTNDKVVMTEKDGKAIERHVRVAKDNLEEVKGIKDLANHHCQCIKCHTEIERVHPKFWTLDDANIVHPCAKKAALEMLEEAKTMKSDSFMSAMPDVRVSGLKWDDAVNNGTFLHGRPHVEFSTQPYWTVKNAQDLRNLGFGDPKKKQNYWAQFGFKPRDIRKAAPRPGDAVLGDVIDFSGLIG